jgi:predicted metal-dependent hydrolase
MATKVERFFVQRMKTKWGSCNAEAKSLRLNTELARKPPECLEYVLVHEMVHLLVRRHNAAFIALMDRYLPNWQHVRKMLNAEPLSHVDWSY